MQLVIEEETKKDPETVRPGGDDGDVKDVSEGAGSDNEEEEYEEFFRIYEYDLQDFNKVKTQDLRQYGDDFDEDSLNSDDFGRYKDGFYYIRQKWLDEDKSKFFNFEIFLKGDKYSMDNSEKFDDNSDVEYCLNEKGERLLISFLKDGNYILQKYSPDPKDKKFKKAEDIKIKTDLFELTKDNISITIKPLLNDFILIFKKPKE